MKEKKYFAFFWNGPEERTELHLRNQYRILCLLHPSRGTKTTLIQVSNISLKTDLWLHICEGPALQVPVWCLCWTGVISGIVSAVMLLCSRSVEHVESRGHVTLVLESRWCCIRRAGCSLGSSGCACQCAESRLGALLCGCIYFKQFSDYFKVIRIALAWVFKAAFLINCSSVRAGVQPWGKGVSRAAGSGSGGDGICFFSDFLLMFEGKSPLVLFPWPQIPLGEQIPRLFCYQISMCLSLFISERVMVKQFYNKICVGIPFRKRITSLSW